MSYRIQRWVLTKIFPVDTTYWSFYWSFQFMASGPRTEKLTDSLERSGINSAITVLDYPLPVVEERQGWIRILKPCSGNFQFRGRAFDGWTLDSYLGFIWAESSNYPTITKPNLCEDCGWMCEQQCFRFNPRCFLSNLIKE